MMSVNVGITILLIFINLSAMYLFHLSIYFIIFIIHYPSVDFKVHKIYKEMYIYTRIPLATIKRTGTK